MYIYVASVCRYDSDSVEDRFSTKFGASFALARFVGRIGCLELSYGVHGVLSSSAKSFIGTREY